MPIFKKILPAFFILLLFLPVQAQEPVVKSDLLTLDRLFSNEFRQERLNPIRWIDGGESYLALEPSEIVEDALDFVRYETSTQERSIFISAEKLIPRGEEKPISVVSYSLSPDQTKVLIFNNTRRVWRSNTKGDYWVFDTATKQLKKLGAELPEASLMFAKFSPDNKFVAYVHKLIIRRKFGEH